MSAAARTPLPTGVVVVGDMLVDIVQDEDGGLTRCAGGAGLNLAVGVHRLGTPALLAAPIASDELGAWLRSVAADEGVPLVALAGSQQTGVATSRRSGGEPTYEFSASISKRHYAFTAADARAMTAGNVLVVNSFPMHDPEQVAALIDVVRRTGMAFVVDPNVRPTLVHDVQAYWDGFRRLAEVADVVKLSLQDLALLEGGASGGIVDQLLSCGVRAVVLTMAERGASVRTRGGVVVEVPVPRRSEPVIDTMGAGDATLARLVCGLAQHGADLTACQWHELLVEAMDLAADVCRTTGGGILADVTTTPRSER